MAKSWHLCRFEGGCATSVAPDVDYCDAHAPEPEPEAPRPARSGGDPRQQLRELDASLFVDFAEEALTAERACAKCAHPVPDWSARTNAARLALEHGWGRAPVAPEGMQVGVDDEPARWSPAERAAAAVAVRSALAGHGVDLDEVRRVARDAVA